MQHCQLLQFVYTNCTAIAVPACCSFHLKVWDLSEAPLSFSIEGSKYFQDMLLSSCGVLPLMTGQQDFPSRLQSVGS